MQYSDWGWLGKDIYVSKLGFGTTRFFTDRLTTREGIEEAAQLVRHAIHKGINYFDVAPTYANGYAENILGTAFRDCGEKIYVAAKTGLTIDKSSDDLRRRLEHSLNTLHRDAADFYFLWSVMDLNQYRQVMETGGLYDGALKAKNEGLIGQLCISLHCGSDEAMKIIEDGCFEGIMISLNAMNYRKWIPVIKAAKQRNMGVVTMNSLAGGVIPRYSKLFESLDNSDDPVAIKGLRFVTSIPEIDVALSGMPTIDQIDENCRAFETSGFSVDLSFEIKAKETLCSGCNYCAPCTVGIPISACMQAYNHRIMVESSEDNVDEQKLSNEVFTRIRANGADFPSLRKCIKCRACEKRCTQKIGISERMEILSALAEKHGYTTALMTERLHEIEKACAGKTKIGIWPAADYASRVFDFWKNTEFENRCIYFNSSEAVIGTTFRGKAVLGPDKIEKSGVEAIVIMHHRLQNIIYHDLLEKTGKSENNISIIRLHRDTDVDWFNRMI